VPDIFFKPYPANHFTHTVIDAARALRQRGLSADDIERVQVGVPAPIVRTIGEPIEVKRRPETAYMAQFSGPYAVAAGLFGGGGLGVGLDDFTDELARDPDRRRLMAKVSVVADDECTAIFPHQFPAVVTVRTTIGEEIVEKVLANRGGPQHPLTYDELATKFADNAGRLLPETVVDAVRSTIATLDELPDLSTLLTPLAVPLPDHKR
jgi:2-methylcitrate dehydratase PrpD